MRRLSCDNWTIIGRWKIGRRWKQTPGVLCSWKERLRNQLMLCRVCLKPESTAEVNFAEGTQWCVCLHACAPKMNLGWHKQCVTSSVHSIRHFVCFLVSINTEILELNCNNEYHSGVRNLLLWWALCWQASLHPEQPSGTYSVWQDKRSHPYVTKLTVKYSNFSFYIII